MIGDWVKFDEDICSVDEVRLDGTVVLTSMDTDLTSIDGSQIEDEEIESIPLTAKILKKNGFVKQWNNNWQFSGNHSIIISEDFYIEIFELSVRLDYVHELQHALKLCGINKEIII